MLNKENITNKSLFDYEGTLAEELLKSKTCPWEILPRIAEYILTLGTEILNSSKDYTLIRGADGFNNVWVSKTAIVAKGTNIYGPTIIGAGTEIRYNAFIRGKVIIGENCVIGNSCEIKNSVILNNVQIPHFNYVGDSILGNNSHLGAGVILSNLKSSKHTVYIGHEISTNLRKVGAFIGDNVDIGCNSVLNPGTVIGKNTIIHPLSCITGVIPNDSIVTTQTTITQRRKEQWDDFLELTELAVL